MSIKDLTITDQNVQSTYVQSQPDRLTGTAQQNKAVFDALPQLIIQRFNLLLEALAGTGAAGEIPIGPIEGVTAENVQQALEAIQQNLTAYINKIKAATGAAEVGVSAISGMQAQNVQKALEELRTAIDNIVSGIIPGGSITADMIQDGAIVQLGALLAVAAAAAYNPSGTYAIGNYCTHEGKLHKCHTPIPSGEAWNKEHWTETTVAAELDGKANLISPQWRSLPLASRFPEQSYANYYYKTQENIVNVSFFIDSGDKFQNGEVIANLPVGFRPGYTIARCVAGDGISLGNGIITAAIQVYANGNIVLFHCNSDIRWLLGEFTFLAEN